VDGTAVIVDVGGGGVCHALLGTETIRCRPRKRLLRHRELTSSILAVGDRVAVTLLPDRTGVIEEIYPRVSVVSRKAAGRVPREQVLAANLDQAAAVVSLREPDFKAGTAIQLCVGARQGGMEPLVVLNKADLGTPEEVAAALQPLRHAGLRCIATSARNGQGLDELRRLLLGRWTLFFGQSGAGKSSLLNEVCPEAGARTQAVRAIGKGKHTTSGSRLHALPGGGFVVDTPGVRVFSFWSQPGEDSVAGVFPEITRLAHGCRFRDCVHLHEPDCAVKAAVARGEVDSDRYRQFLRLTRR